MEYKIYLITNTVNQKRYVGFTGRTIAARWRAHCNDAQKKKSWILHAAIRKYGSEVFIIKELYNSTNKYHTLNVMESFFIIKIKSHYQDGHGYNMTYGGDGAKGYKHSVEHRQWLRERFSGDKNPMFGKPVSAETKQLWSLQRCGSGNSRAGEYEISYPTGKIIKINDLVAWCKDNAIIHSTARSSCRQGHKLRNGICIRRIDA